MSRREPESVRRIWTTGAVRAGCLVVCALATTGCTMNKDEYVAFLTRADSVMGAHQDRLQRDFRLGQWPRYDYDEGVGVIVFPEHDTAHVVADVQFVGEVSRRDSTFTWAWDLPALSAFVAASRSARRYGWLHGVRHLRDSGWHGDVVDGWEMTSLTGR